MCNLSNIRCARDRGDQAVEMLHAILPVVARTLGETRVGMIMTQTNLARAYIACESYTEARQSGRPLRKEVSSRHPNRSCINQEDRFILAKLGGVDEVEGKCIAVLEKIERCGILGPEHPSVYFEYGDTT